MKSEDFTHRCGQGAITETRWARAPCDGWRRTAFFKLQMPRDMITEPYSALRFDLFVECHAKLSPSLLQTCSVLA
ncbi:hypothetical protein ROLI_037710 [Roseobacter fucihabitans]|uniref:Uncharacterized protein n=1 Tax=Roseobacter fucihabitans TaxID=1537242 RepID=A0ABZ2BXI6_9RHOB|nr:hypothetical protein [Roseobacter litoralis]MBC6967816.1 hypothetical protein [Roseobacter litoralis]